MHGSYAFLQWGSSFGGTGEVGGRLRSEAKDTRVGFAFKFEQLAQNRSNV
jgi:hypothetical protein